MKTERFEMRLDPQTVEQVDRWRAKQVDLPSRAEAMRRLVDAGLATLNEDPRRQIRLSDGEKLILTILGDLTKHLDVKGKINADFVEETLLTGHYWGLGWKYSDLFHGHMDTPDAVSEVLDMLEMWSFIESGYAYLSKEDQKHVEIEAEPFGKDPRFRGFDGNNESDYLSIVKYLVDHLDRFVGFTGRDLNSHMSSVDTYRRMLLAFQPMKHTLSTGGELSASQIIELLKARIHPEFSTGS